MTEENQYQEYRNAMSVAKIQLMSKPNIAFFANLLLNISILPNPEIQTARTNGLVIQFNPDFFLGLSKEDRLFVLMHEVLHIALMHPLRAIGKKEKLWMVACDHVVNLVLEAYGMHFSGQHLADKRFKGMTTEKVYRLLYEEDNDDEPDMDDQEPPPSEEQQKQMEQEVQDTLVKASVQTEMNGQTKEGIPSELQKMFDELNNPVIPWTILLQRFLQETAKNEYLFTRPNRRYFPKFYLPSLQGEGLSRIDFVVDTSGSIGNKEFTAFLSEVDQVLKQYKPEKIGFSQFDHQYRGTEIIDKFTDITSVKMKGGGGTDISSTMKHLAEEVKDTKAIVVFTDGYLETNVIQPNVPVLWAVYDNPNFKAHFGETVHFNLEDLVNGT